MITAKSTKDNYKTILSDGKHEFISDTPVASGGGDTAQRPGSIFASSLAACMNITTRTLLDAENIAYNDVTVYLDMDRDNPELLTFKRKIVIDADISDEKKNEIIQRVYRCPVCKMMTMPKRFEEME